MIDLDPVVAKTLSNLKNYFKPTQDYFKKMIQLEMSIGSSEHGFNSVNQLVEQYTVWKAPYSLITLIRKLLSTTIVSRILLPTTSWKRYRLFWWNGRPTCFQGAWTRDLRSSRRPSRRGGEEQRPIHIINWVVHSQTQSSNSMINHLGLHLQIKKINPRSILLMGYKKLKLSTTSP